jgi:transcriptional regulator GlxA family with amidase domain
VIPGDGWNDRGVHGAWAEAEARVVDDGDLVTAGGVTSGIDMALWLVERHFGADLADAVAGEIEHPRHGEVWRGQGG